MYELFKGSKVHVLAPSDRDTCTYLLPRARMRSRGTVFGLSVSLFVCLSASFLGCLRVTGVVRS